MKNLCLLLSAFCLVSTVAVAKVDKDFGSVNSRQQDRHAEESDAPAWRSTVSMYAAIPMGAHLNNPSAVQFNQTSGVVSSCCDSDTSKLTKLSSGIGLGVYRDCFWDWLQAGISYEFYMPFYYPKHETNAAIATGTPSLPAENLGPNYERSFTLSNQSAMLNFEFGLPRNWAWEVCSMSITPIVGAGVGLGVNTVSNFQAVGWSTAAPSGTTPTGVTQLTTLSRPKTHVSFAWQINAGFNFRPVDSDMSFSLAYRFYDGGHFTTQSSFMLNDNVSAIDYGKEVALTAWTGRLRANEVVMCLDFQF